MHIHLASCQGEISLNILYKVDGTLSVYPFDVIRSFKLLQLPEKKGDIENFILSARIMMDNCATGDRRGPSTLVFVPDVDSGKLFGHFLFEGSLDRSASSL